MDESSMSPPKEDSKPARIPNLERLPNRDRGKRAETLRKNSISLLDPEATAIPSLLDLTQQDFEVNAPVNSFLLNGEELLTALDISTPM